MTPDFMQGLFIGIGIGMAIGLVIVVVLVWNSTRKF